MVICESVCISRIVFDLCKCFVTCAGVFHPSNCFCFVFSSKCFPSEQVFCHLWKCFVPMSHRSFVTFYKQRQRNEQRIITHAYTAIVFVAVTVKVCLIKLP